jgi:hypothetical protein
VLKAFDDLRTIVLSLRGLLDTHMRVFFFYHSAAVRAALAAVHSGNHDNAIVGIFDAYFVAKKYNLFLFVNKSWSSSVG